MKQRWYLALAGVLLCLALPGWSAGSKHLKPYGEKNFPVQYSDAVDTYFAAEKLVRAGRYAEASQILNTFWTKYPQGNAIWQQLSQEAGGIFTGHPPVYVSLQMITKIADTFATGLPRARENLRFTVVMPQSSTGFDPSTHEEARTNKGTPITHKLDTRIAEANFRVVQEATWLFTEYLAALTGGKARFTVQFAPLKITVPILNEALSKDAISSRPANEGYDLIWQSVDAATRSRTDFWMIIFPSHKPTNDTLRRSIYFTGGGMGSGPDGSPCIIIDDQFLLRAQPHFKVSERVFDPIERRLYLPQFMQHEVFHHFFAIYPEFGLEATSHQWHQRSSWPQDFVGIFESDYYQEGFEKRIKSASVPLIAKLRFQGPPDILWRTIKAENLKGQYHRDPVENNWHKGQILLSNNDLQWKNEAGATWRLAWNNKGELITGKDNPYYASNPASGRTFKVRLRREASGSYSQKVEGFLFQNEFYRKVD